MIKLINSKVFNKKVGITFFSECVKSAILLKNEFSHFAFLNKSSIFNGLSKRLSRLFTAIASLEEFINGRKVTHIITTFFRGNGANTTFLIKSHDTKKVGITILIKNYWQEQQALPVFPHRLWFSQIPPERESGKSACRGKHPPSPLCAQKS